MKKKGVVVCPWGEASGSEMGLIMPKSTYFSCSDICLGWRHVRFHANCLKRMKVNSHLFQLSYTFAASHVFFSSSFKYRKREIKCIKPAEGNAVVCLFFTYYYFTSCRLVRTCKIIIPTATVTWPLCAYIKALKLTPYTVMQNTTYVQRTWFMGLVRLHSELLDLVQIQSWFKYNLPAGLALFYFIYTLIYYRKL